MSKYQKRKLEFYLTLSLALILMVSCILAVVDGSYVTFAWFTTNRVASVNFTSLVATSLDTVKSIAVYPYVKNVSDGTTVFTYSQTPVSSQTLGNYSLLTPTENSLLLEITLTDYAQSSTSLDLTAHTNASSYLGELNADGTLKTQLAETNNSLSSIVCFYAFASTDVATVNSGGTDYYSLTLSATQNAGGSKLNFVKSNALVKDVTMCSLTPASKFYLILDYDATLIEYIYSANIGNDAINNVDNMASDGQSYISYIADFFFQINAIHAAEASSL